MFPRLWKGQDRPVLVDHSKYDDIAGVKRYYADVEETKLVNLTTEMLSSHITPIMKLCGYEDEHCVLYVFRKSSCKWAARCGAQQHAIMAAGRWKESSKAFLDYIQAGQLDGATWVDSPEDDPIRKIWVFKPTAIMMCMTTLAVPH